MHRRALFALLGTTALSGCSTVSGLFEEEQHVGLGSIVVSNWDDEPHDVTVRIEADGTLVGEWTVESDAIDGRAAGGGTITCAWADRSGPFVVRARHESSDGWSALALDDAADPPEVVELDIWVGHLDERTSTIRLWHGPASDATDCRPTTHTPKENAF